jgi:nucleotide-binding universal stress UspA family protein
MVAVPRLRRRVYVLGRGATLDVEPVAREAAAHGEQLVLLSVGLRITPEQESVVWEALRLAGTLPLWIDAVLVATPEEVAEMVDPGEEVTILASGRQRKHLERALRSKLGSEAVRPAGQPAGNLPENRAPVSTNGRPSQTERIRTAASFDTSPPVLAPARARVDAGTRSMSPQRGGEGLPQNDSVPLGGEGSESVEAIAGREVPETFAETSWTRDQALVAKKAPLRVYLGAAPGVGKTFAMLGEGQRRRSRGTDVVVAIVHTYSRPKTLEMLEGLEVIPPQLVDYRGTTFEEMDVDALIARRPEVALIDELAHSNVPGSRRAKRWEDVLDVLAEGITVITTLNVQHLASVNDVVAKVTGIRQQETVPDWVLDIADDVELVDMSPRSLQRRMMHGNVYPDPRKAELALRRFFTMDNLTALRELALMRVANQVDDELLARWSKTSTPETRERVLVCVSRKEISEELIRRGGRIAQRTRSDLLVVHVSAGERPPDREWIARVRALVESLGGEFQILEGDDPVEAVLSFAYQQRVTQILVGESLRSWWQELLRGSFVNRLIRKASNIDVHVIARRER